jgi:hypothetical protein
MSLDEVVREALEIQVLESDPERAATVIGAGVTEHGAESVASALLDAAAVALRRMVAGTEEAYDQAELLAQLALDGAVPEHRLELLGQTLTAAAATAGGVRPPIDALSQRLGQQELLFGSWLALLTVVKVVSIALEDTEAVVVEDIVAAIESY